MMIKTKETFSSVLERLPMEEQPQNYKDINLVLNHIMKKRFEMVTKLIGRENAIGKKF